VVVALRQPERVPADAADHLFPAHARLSSENRGQARRT
jgi:hypothetical protein